MTSKTLPEMGAEAGRKLGAAMIVAARQFREAADRAAASMWDFAESLHKPVDVGEEGDPRPYCTTCKTDWPCEESTRIHDKRQEVLR